MIELTLSTTINKVSLIANETKYTLVLTPTNINLSLLLNYGVNLGETSVTAYRGDRGKTAYDHSQLEGNPHATAKEDITGLKTTDQPEFANTQLTTLTSGGAIAALVASWLGATAKSVLSYIANISSKLYYSIYPQPQAVSETGTFQLALTHLEIVTRVNSAADCLCNIPLNDTVAFPIGSVITIEQLGVGIVTATAISGVTLNGDPKTQGQYKFIQLWKTAINTWVVIGGTT